MTREFIAFPEPEVGGRRLSEITNNVQQPPSYEDSITSSLSHHAGDQADVRPSTSSLQSSGSIRHSHPTPPPVPARPHQYHSISHIKQSDSINDGYTDAVLHQNVQPLKIHKRESFRPQPPTPISPAISDRYSIPDQASLSPTSATQRPRHPHSRTSSIFSVESRVEPFYDRNVNEDDDTALNKLTLEEQEEQDLAQAIELSKAETSQPFAYDDNDSNTISSHTHGGDMSMDSHRSYSTANTSSYDPSGGPYSWVNPSDVTWNQDESTFVKKEKMRQHVENHNLRKWQEDMDDVTSEWHQLVNEETLQAFDKAEIARQSALFEFMRTEKSYYNDLLFLEEVFVPPIRDTSMIPRERREQFLNDAVYNLSNLVANHRRGLMRIFERQNEEHPLIESVADLILRACIIWQDDYEAYIKHWPIQEATLKSEMQSNKKFADHLEACHRHPKAQRQSIIALLQRPVFRLPRYPLLLNRMLEYTPDDHADRHDLPVASRAISDIAKSTQPGIELSNNKVKFWEMASALDFKVGELHDIDLLNDTRTLLHDGVLFKRQRTATDLHGWHAKRLIILDNYILITEPTQKKKTDPIRYMLTSRPIPLELANIEEENLSPTHRTNCLLADERRADGSRILFTHTEPEREVYGFVMSNVGSGKVYKLYATSPQERDAWKARISEAITIRQAFVDANKILTSRTLTDNYFQQSVLANTDKNDKSGSNRINSSSTFSWGTRKYVAFSTPSGVYLGYEDDRESYRKVVGLKGVDGVSVLAQFSLLILLVDGQLYGYDLEEICPTSSRGPRRQFGRVRLCSSSERVTHYTIGSTVGSKAIIAYVSNKLLSKSQVQFFEPLPINNRVQAFNDAHKVKKPKRDVWLRQAMPPVALQTTGTAKVLFPFPSSRHVAIVEDSTVCVLDPSNNRRTLVLPQLHGRQSAVFKDRQQVAQYKANVAAISESLYKGKTKAVELFTTRSGEYILIYDSFGLFIDHKGVPLKNANVIRWNGKVESAAVAGEYLVLFYQEHMEVREKISGKLLQGVKLAKDVRMLSRGSVGGESLVVADRIQTRSHSFVGTFDHAFALNAH